MQFIGQGYQYKVYDLGNGRVRKIPQSYWYSFRKIIEVQKKQAGRSFFPALLIAFREIRYWNRIVRELRRRFNDGSLPKNLFGNPIFTNDNLQFEQDKVATIEEIFAKNDFKESKKAINDYIELQKQLWSYGLHDAVFKFQPNYGIDAHDVVVCIDFGEMVFTKKEAAESVQKKKWLTRPSYQKWENGPLKAYYTEAMETAMTEENIELWWGENSIL